MTTHELKVEQPYFQGLRTGHKTFEVRRDDRGFQPGDLLILRECWLKDGVTEYTGRSVDRFVSYVLRDGERFGIMPGFVVLGLSDDCACVGAYLCPHHANVHRRNDVPMAEYCGVCGSSESCDHDVSCGIGGCSFWARHAGEHSTRCECDEDPCICGRPAAGRSDNSSRAARRLGA